MRRTPIIRHIRAVTAVCLLVGLGVPAGASAQTSEQWHDSQPDSVVVVPGARYRAGGWKAFMSGRAYRDLWTTPIKVEVADLSQLGGGLTPLRVGGGAQTKVLHVRGANGIRYVFRSVEKFASRGIPEVVRGTPYESVLQDEVSSLHPTAALVVGPLLRAVDVLHVEPRLVVIPDDPRLGEFREEFAGMLALFEERPDEGPEDAEGFAGSRRIVGSERLFELIEQDARHRVDALALLAARLVDIFLGDRDRSIDNWWWARFDSNGGYIWKPIPRDRDQAFIKLDGFLRVIFGFYEPELTALGEGYSSSGIVGLTRSGWALDRRFLVGIDRGSWDSVAVELQARLTDSVIDEAVLNMPPEHVSLEGPALASALKRRRDELFDAAGEFYEIVTEYADVHATDQADRAVITRYENGSVEISLYGHDESGQLAVIPYFDRVFRRAETREIRLYLHAGADSALVLGHSPQSIRVRVIGGAGTDVLADSSRSGVGTRFYDADQDTRFMRAPRTSISHRRAVPRVAWDDDAPEHPDWGFDWSQAPSISMGGNTGLFVIYSTALTRYGFLKDPYGSRSRFTIGYSSGAPGFLLSFRQEIRDAIPHVHPALELRFTEVEVLNYFGFGNDTPTLRSRTFRRLQQRQLLAAPSVRFSNDGPMAFDVGLVLKQSSADTVPEKPNLLSVERPYGSGTFVQLGARADFTIDTRDDAAAPSRGFKLAGGGSIYPAIGSVDRGAFGEIHGEVSTFLSPSPSGNQTLALRLGAKKVFGMVPFHEAAIIGGRGSMRGFHDQRFTGDASVFANAEIRLYLARMSVLMPGEFGVFGLADVGRVFYEGESPGSWHAGVGGGIWIAPFRRSNTLSAAVAQGERLAFYFGSGFAF